jgi:hypothetical protein
MAFLLSLLLLFIIIVYASAVPPHTVKIKKSRSDIVRLYTSQGLRLTCEHIYTRKVFASWIPRRVTHSAVALSVCMSIYVTIA